MDTIQVKRIPITPEVRDFIFNRDEGRCRYCGSKNPPFHLDHVYPVSKGGETSIDNLVLACRKCNSEKSAKVGMYPKPIGYFDELKLVKVDKISTVFSVFVFMLLCNIGYFIMMIPEIKSIINGEPRYISPILTFMLIGTLIKSGFELYKSIISKEKK